MTGAEPWGELQRVRAERDAVQRELDRLRAIPELRAGQRLRSILRRKSGADPATGSPLEGGADADFDLELPGDMAGVEPLDPYAWLADSPVLTDTLLRSVAIQVVLFGNEPEQQRRLAHAIRATLVAARSRLGIASFVVRYGDCSPRPCMDEADVDGLRRIIGDIADQVTFTHFNANLGSSGGSNALAELGDEGVIWVLNPDTFPAPSAAVEMLAVLSVDKVGAAEARQVPIEHQKYFDPVSGDTSWACGFSVMLRRAAFEQIGGFDPHFFPMYCDDVDLSWRLRVAGWAVRHVPRAVVVHDKPIAIGGSVRWSDDAARSSHLARLWLYRRYGRPDLEVAFLASIDREGDPIAAEAIAEFERRVADGDSPAVIPGGDKVATFVANQYAPARFGYAG